MMLWLMKCYLFVALHLSLTEAAGLFTEDGEPCICMDIPNPEGGLCACYGDPNNITVAANASVIDNFEQGAEDDVDRLELLRPCFEGLAVKYCFHHAVLAAWASKETRAGLLIELYNGYTIEGDYGIFGCDVSKVPGCKSFPPKSCQYAKFMLNYLIGSLYAKVQSFHPSWSPEMVLQGALAAYNGGLSAVKQVSDINELDIGSEDGEYFRDIIARTQWLIGKANWQCGPPVETCATKKCGKWRKCEEGSDGPKCVCGPGRKWDDKWKFCFQVIIECLPNQRKVGFNCVTYKACESYPCQNGGSCVDISYGKWRQPSYSCDCPSGYTGKRCHTVIP